MKKSVFILAILTISFTSCKKEVKAQDVIPANDSVTVLSDDHNAMNSIDFQGTYKGSLPCADCEAIETTIALKADTYTKETIYKGKSKEVFKETGKYSWNKEGNTITLSASEIPNQYFVGENILIHLDAKGRRIEGDLASKYQLEKVEISEPVVSVQKQEAKSKVALKNSKWRLIKLHGNSIVKSKDSKKEYGIIFATDGRFSAFAGCNSMAGSYELNEEASRIKFSKVVSTMMACQDMLTEQELAKVLEITDNYNFDGQMLKLNKGRMATIAEFEIIK